MALYYKHEDLKNPIFLNTMTSDLTLGNNNNIEEFLQKAVMNKIQTIAVDILPSHMSCYYDFSMTRVARSAWAWDSLLVSSATIRPRRLTVILR